MGTFLKSFDTSFFRARDEHIAPLRIVSIRRDMGELSEKSVFTSLPSASLFPLLRIFRFTINENHRSNGRPPVFST
jgi:hypothetical protein